MATPSNRPGGTQSLVGTVLGGRYRLERLIGEGGMGAVYQAQHMHMRKRLAVKVLHPEMSRLPEVVARFEREAMAAAHIEHPNVAAATDFGKLDDGSFYLALEYVEGKSLREILDKGPLGLGRTLHVARQIAGALARAHSLGIVHRDLKPENVMLVSRDGDDDFVKVLDFGIARVPVGELAGEAAAPGQALTQVGMVYGTPEYMAPEQAVGQPVDARADLYALGVMMFEMIAGARPYDNDDKVVLLGMHVTAAIPRMSERAPSAGVPPEVEAIVTRLMSKPAGDRFSDARDLLDALDRAAERGGAAAPLQSSASWRLGDRLSSPKAVAIAGAGTLAFVAATVIVVTAAVRGGAAPASTSGSSASAAVPARKPADPKTEQLVADARAKIDKGDFASAIDELKAAEASGSDRADVHALLERAYTGARNTPAAMREADLWLGADAGAAEDAKLEEDVRSAALLRDAQDEAFALLESKMGARGCDLLYDIAYGAAGRAYPQAAARAKRSLDVESVRKHASPALAIVFDFRGAQTCEAKYALLERARNAGDARMLPVLQSYEATRGCGFLGRADCYPCMHRDSALKDATDAIRRRNPG